VHEISRQRHCEECNDEAIQPVFSGLLQANAFAMTKTETINFAFREMFSIFAPTMTNFSAIHHHHRILQG
jgi:hypothetical protein